MPASSTRGDDEQDQLLRHPVGDHAAEQRRAAARRRRRRSRRPRAGPDRRRSGSPPRPGRPPRPRRRTSRASARPRAGGRRSAGTASARAAAVCPSRPRSLICPPAVPSVCRCGPTTSTEFIGGRCVSTTLPSARRPSRSACARAASASGYVETSGRHSPAATLSRARPASPGMPPGSALIRGAQRPAGGDPAAASGRPVVELGRRPGGEAEHHQPAARPEQLEARSGRPRRRPRRRRASRRRPAPAPRATSPAGRSRRPGRARARRARDGPCAAGRGDHRAPRPRGPSCTSSQPRPPAADGTSTTSSGRRRLELDDPERRPAGADRGDRVREARRGRRTGNSLSTAVTACSAYPPGTGPRCATTRRPEPGRVDARRRPRRPRPPPRGRGRSAAPAAAAVPARRGGSWCPAGARRWPRPRSAPAPAAGSRSGELLEDEVSRVGRRRGAGSRAWSHPTSSSHG